MRVAALGILAITGIFLTPDISDGEIFICLLVFTCTVAVLDKVESIKK